MTRSISLLKKRAWALGCCILLLGAGVFGQNLSEPAAEEAVSLIRQIYEEISSDGSAPVNWDLVRSHFLDEAVIVLRSSAEGHTVFTLDGFIEDFRTFYENPQVVESGFREEIIRIRPQIYRHAASIGVVYEASIPGSERPPQQGIDFWLLTRIDSTWKVLAISNEIIPPGREIPALFRETDLVP